MGIQTPVSTRKRSEFREGVNEKNKRVQEKTCPSRRKSLRKSANYVSQSTGK